MAGKLCFGASVNNAGNLKNSKAFCEGRFYRSRGTAASFPVTGNPHEIGSESSDAWVLGWDAAQAGVGTYVSESGCCAALGDIIA